MSEDKVSYLGQSVLYPNTELVKVCVEERMEVYFLANCVEEDKKVSVLLTVIGVQAYKILRILCDPDLLKTKSFSELCRILKNNLQNEYEFSRND